MKSNLESDNPREGWMAFCKRRALEYLDRGDVSQAFASMRSDITKDPATHTRENIARCEIQFADMLTHHATLESTRHWIESFPD